MHAENGIVINEIIKRFLKDGRTAPKYHALTRPTIAEAEGVHRAIAIAEMAESPVYIVHLSCTDALNKVREARDGAFPRSQKRARSTFPLHRRLRDGWDVKYVMTPPLREKQITPAVEGLKMTTAGNLDRPLPVLYEGAKGTRQGRFFKDPERRAGR